MFLRLAVVCAVLGGVLSAKQLSSEETGYKVSDKVQLDFYSYIDKRESGNFIHTWHNATNLSCIYLNYRTSLQV